MQDKLRQHQDLLKKIYGEIPKKPIHLSYENKYINDEYAASKASLKGVTIYLELEDKEAEITLTSVMPKRNTPCPVIILLSNEESIPNRFLPLEEIIDRGYGVIYLYSNNITENNSDFKSKLAGKTARSRKKKTAAGKISVWAYALIRVVDYACSLSEIDKNAVILAGHGIFGRSAALAAAYDERVSYVIANGLSSYPPPYSDKLPYTGMTVHDCPYLYSPSFINDPFGDEYHVLVQVCQNSKLMIGSADEGYYSNPSYEIGLISSAVSKACIKEGKEIPTAPIRLDMENVSYHMRGGSDYFSREDWNIYLDFVDKNIK